MMEMVAKIALGLTAGGNLREELVTWHDRCDQTVFQDLMLQAPIAVRIGLARI